MIPTTGSTDSDFVIASPIFALNAWRIGEIDVNLTRIKDYRPALFSAYRPFSVPAPDASKEIRPANERKTPADRGVLIFDGSFVFTCYAPTDLLAVIHDLRGNEELKRERAGLLRFKNLLNQSGLIVGQNSDPFTFEEAKNLHPVGVRRWNEASRPGIQKARRTRSMRVTHPNGTLIDVLQLG